MRSDGLGDGWSSLAKIGVPLISQALPAVGGAFLGPGGAAAGSAIGSAANQAVSNRQTAAPVRSGAAPAAATAPRPTVAPAAGMGWYLSGVVAGAAIAGALLLLRNRHGR